MCMNKNSTPKKKVTGIGGIFFKCDDPKKMNEWYEKHLGIPVTDWGALFAWREKDNPEKEGYTVWSTLPCDVKDFSKSKKDFRINYRVKNIEALVKELKKANVTIEDEITDSEYGKFVHILDPEGNSIELFEPAA
jgi:catechol 2,3-dioxygenase-like lactoylglutathione lyase family enzyme